MSSTYAIVDTRPGCAPEEQAWLAVSEPLDTWERFVRFRDTLWPHCPILDIETGEVVSPGMPEEEPYAQ